MLRYFVKRSGGETYDRVMTPPHPSGWVRANTVSQEELDQLVDWYGFDANILRDVLDKSELPRVEMLGDDMYVFLRHASRGRRGKVHTTPLLLAKKGEIFASITASEIDESKLISTKQIVQVNGSAGLLLGTMAGVLTVYEDLLQHAERYIDDTAHRLRSHEVTNQDFITFVSVEDNLNEYRRNLDGMLVVAMRLQEILPKNGEHEALGDVVLYIRQMLVAIESYRQNITNIRNAYSAIANHSLNRRMKALTILTLFVALPNVFYGMYGMNVALPFQTAPWAFWAVVGASFVAMIIVLLFGRKKDIL